MISSRHSDSSRRPTSAKISAMLAGLWNSDSAIDLQGLAMRNTYQGSFSIGKRKADVRLEPHQTLHFAMDQKVTKMGSAAVMRGSTRLPGNMRFARCNGGSFVLADAWLLDDVKLNETLDLLRDGFHYAIWLAKNKKTGQTPSTTLPGGRGPSVDRTAIERTLAQCGWPEDAVVAQENAADQEAAERQTQIPDFIRDGTRPFQSGPAQDDNRGGEAPPTENRWELRLRLRGDTVPVQMVADEKSIRLSRTIVRTVPDLRTTCGQALLHEAICMNTHLRGARLALAGSKLVAECRLDSGQIRTESLSAAAYAVAAASRFTKNVLMLLAGQPDVASSYTRMFCSGERGSGACASDEPCC